MARPKGKNRLNVDWQLIHELALQGASLRSIAEQFGISVNSVLSHSRRHKWRLNETRIDQSRAQRMLAQPNANGILPSIGECAIKLFPALASETKLGLAIALRNSAQAFAEMQRPTILKRQRELKTLIEGANVLFGWDEAKRSDNSAIKDDLFALSPLQLAKLATREAESIQVQDGNGQKLD